ncbi:MAG TPA: sugar ABC transporter permease, partial [Mesotoga infera]|nr:sugar ABC transporter permease [Mesotoga infera]
MSYNRQSKKYWRETWKAYLFLLPSLVILGVFTLWPIVFSLVLSFFKWDYTSASRYFIGLDNYKELFRISYPVQMNLFYSIINMAVYVVTTLVLVQIVHYFLCSVSKYDKPKKGHATLYILFASILAGYVILRNLSAGLTVAGILYGLAMVAFGLALLFKRRGSIQSFKMKSSQWVTLMLFIGIYYLLSRVLLKESIDFLQYFMLAK